MMRDFISKIQCRKYITMKIEFHFVLIVDGPTLCIVLYHISQSDFRYKIP